MLYSQSKGNAKNHIIFIHGNSQSLELWDTLINEEALNYFTLVTFDLPGHGHSFRSKRPEIDYTLRGMAEHILDFISKYQQTDYIIVANSIATNLIGEIAKPLFNCKGLFLIGASVIGSGIAVTDILQPNPNLGSLFSDTPEESELNLLIDDMAYTISDDLKQKCKELFLSTDPLFRTTLNNSIMAQDWSNEIYNLQKMNLPIAIVYGKNDKINQVNYLNKATLKKWKDEILFIDNAGHLIQLDQPKILAEMIREFADFCFK